VEDRRVGALRIGVAGRLSRPGLPRDLFAERRMGTAGSRGDGAGARQDRRAPSGSHVAQGGGAKPQLDPPKGHPGVRQGPVCGVTTTPSCWSPADFRIEIRRLARGCTEIRTKLGGRSISDFQRRTAKTLCGLQPTCFLRSNSPAMICGLSSQVESDRRSQGTAGISGPELTPFVKRK